MLQDFMRKHRQAILIFILAFIAVPFIFSFGMPTCRPQTQRTQDNVLGSIGGVPMLESEFRRNLEAVAQQRMRYGQERPTYQELDADGTAAEVLDQMVSSSLVTLEERSRDFHVDEDLLVERMHKWQTFQDEEGNFNPAIWDEWVQRNEERGTNWEEIYADVQRGLSRQVYMNMVTAPAGRVLDKDIEKQFEENYTRLKVKYLAVEPPVTPADGNLQTQYDENQDRYRNPEQKVAEYAAISLIPPVPEEAAGLVKQAREGANFAALADEHSGLPQKNGGDMGWVSPSPADAPARKALHALAAGEVSDPQHSLNSYFIFKVEEERTNEESGAREVRARQIMLSSTLPEEDRNARTALAETISEGLKNDGNLAAAAAVAGLEVQRTPVFDNTSTELEGLPRVDVRTFATSLTKQEQDDSTRYDVIAARENLYVGVIIESTEGAVPPLEEIRDRVERDTINALKGKDEYIDRVKALSERIEEEVNDLDLVPGKFPELEAEVKETKEAFTRRDYLYQEQVYVQSGEIFDAFKGKEPGAMAGPLTDFRDRPFFFELVERTEPTEEDRGKWDEEREQLRKNAIRVAENELLQDYLDDLRLRKMAVLEFGVDQVRYGDILGRNLPAREGEAPAEGDNESAADDAAEEATDEAAAEETANAGDAEETAAPAATAEESPEEEAAE